VLPLAVLVGLLLRLAPCVREPAFDFVVDAAYHERLTLATLAAGGLPALDRLSEAPGGRPTAAHLPVGLYPAGALAIRVLSACGVREPRWCLALLVALAGALVAVPVWIGTRAAWGSARAASLAALLSVFLPAHVQRTEGFYYRYDGPGTLLVTLHAALALATLAQARAGRRRALAAGSAAALVAAAWVWRVSLVVLAAELLVSLLCFAVRGARPALRDLWLAIALVGTAGLLPIAYLARQGFLLSPLWVGVAALALALALPPLGPGSRAPARLAALAALTALVAAAARLGPPGDYAGLPALLLARLGLQPGHVPATALVLDVQELRGLALRDLLAGQRQLSVLGAWLLASPAIAWWLAGRPAPRRLLELEPAPAFLALLAAALLLLTLAFERTGVLLAPVAAMALGGLGAALLTPRATPVAAPRAARQERPRRAARSAGAAARGWLAAALAASALAAVVAGVVEASTSWSRLDRNERDALRWLRGHAPRGVVVLSDWDAGYDVQSRAGLATVVDGLLESAENRRRIVESYAALMDRSPEALERFCARYGATWLLVPPGSAIHGMAVVTGDPLAGVIERHEPVTDPALLDHVVVHLVANDLDYPAFRRAFTAGGFQVYEVVPAPRP
jgi:hypothetical protein